MFERVGRNWELGRQSLRVLQDDKRLVVFPVLSTIACLLVLATFAVPIVMTTDFNALQNDRQAMRSATHQPMYYVVLFAFYFVNYTVVAFFNSA